MSLRMQCSETANETLRMLALRKKERRTDKIEVFYLLNMLNSL
ncbi:MAG: hypothetical protein CFH07_00624 [Alphaproteobacteria bacterium MarineAlpha3_Bin6]|nr:MAG: hypothetical protein CFH07_00624 [Alphaproteobacteria bacterium MarineAlpha3_Bin6]